MTQTTDPRLRAIEAADAEVNRILALSDEELLSEAARDGVNVEAQAAECRAVLERAKAAVAARKEAIINGD